jgi:hypothetical protein
MSLGKTWIISPSLVNDARVGYNRRWAQLTVPSYQKNWGQQLGIPNINGDLMPAFGSGDRNSPTSIYGLSGATPNQTVNETISFRNDLSIIRGTHAFKGGYEVLRFRLNSATLANPVNFDFSGSTTGLQANGAAMPNTGSPFAGFLTGYVTSHPQLLLPGRLEGVADSDDQHGRALLQRERIQHQVRADEPV